MVVLWGGEGASPPPRLVGLPRLVGRRGSPFSSWDEDKALLQGAGLRASDVMKIRPCYREQV